MNELNPNTDPLLNKFRESFSEYKANYSPDELQSGWKSVQSNIPAVQPAHTGSFSKILTGKGIAVTGAVAVVVTSAIVLANILFIDSEKNQPKASEPAAVVQNKEITNSTIKDNEIVATKKTALEARTPANSAGNNMPGSVSIKSHQSYPNTGEGKVQDNAPMPEMTKETNSVRPVTGKIELLHFYDTLLCPGASFRFVFVPSGESQRLSLYLDGKTYYLQAGYFSISMDKQGTFPAIFEITGYGFTHMVRKQIIVNDKIGRASCRERV